MRNHQERLTASDLLIDAATELMVAGIELLAFGGLVVLATSLYFVSPEKSEEKIKSNSLPDGCDGNCPFSGTKRDGKAICCKTWR